MIKQEDPEDKEITYYTFFDNLSMWSKRLRLKPKNIQPVVPISFTSKGIPVRADPAGAIQGIPTYATTPTTASGGAGATYTFTPGTNEICELVRMSVLHNAVGAEEMLMFITTTTGDIDLLEGTTGVNIVQDIETPIFPVIIGSIGAIAGTHLIHPGRLKLISGLNFRISMPTLADTKIMTVKSIRNIIQS